MRLVVVVTVTWDLEPQNQNKHSYACFLYLEVKTLGTLNTTMAAYNFTSNHLHLTII